MNKMNYYPSWKFDEDIKRNEEQYIEAIKRVLHSGRLLLGNELKSFEEEFSQYIGADYGIGCDNATNAIFLALKALNIGTGDKVLTVANTAIPTVSAIVQAGATPVFADTNDGGQIDIESVEEKVLDEIKAIVVVHLFGLAADISKIKDIAEKYDLKVIEDCSQAHGTEVDSQKVGSYGDLSVFSFYPTKPLGGFGDAGIILTSNKEYEERIRRLRFYGVEKDYYALESGYNSRMDEIHAAILRNKLTRLNENIEHRTVACEIYRREINHPKLQPLEYDKSNIKPSSYLIPFVYTGNRDTYVKKLSEKGVGTNISYKHPIHLMQAYKYLGYKKGDLPKTEYLCEHIISFPIYDYIDFKDTHKIVNMINETYE